jgi:ubiquitin-conjugating enzyme E2 C
MPLPRDVLLARIRNELNICQRCLRHPIEIHAEALNEMPLDIEVSLVQIPACEKVNGEIRRRFHHRFRMTISEDYPFVKPQVVWCTPIFHPNVMLPEDGGLLCSKQLDGWSFNSTLLMFIKGIEYLLLNPNPGSPFGTPSCTEAAQYFNTRKVPQPPLATLPQPKVVRAR